MASLYLLCTWDLSTCSVMKPLMRPLLSYSGFWRNMKSHYPESMNDICSASRSWSPHSRCLVLWKRWATQRIRVQKRKYPFLAQLSNILPTIYTFALKELAQKETSLFPIFKNSDYLLWKQFKTWECAVFLIKKVRYKLENIQLHG